jgi:hypothetical protein
MTRTIKTGRQDIYIQYVENAAASRGDEDDTQDAEAADSDDDEDYFFKYQYELFSFAAVLGFLNDEQVAADSSYGQDILKVESLNEDDPHRETIDFITQVVQVAEEVDEDEAWDEVLRYADAGVEHFDNEVEDDMDFVRFVQDASIDRWEDRLRESVGTPEEVGSV